MSFYFIAGEPSSFATMVNIACVIKRASPGHRVEAIVPYHALLARMEAREFMDEFDRVWHLPACEFQGNIFRGLVRGWAFKDALQQISLDKDIVVFAFVSMEMSLNLCVKFIQTKCNSAKIVLLRYAVGGAEIADLGGIFSWSRTFLNLIYSFVLGCYPMKSYVNDRGQMMYRTYWWPLPFPELVLSSDCAANATESLTPASQQRILPYPAVVRPMANAGGREKFVVFFGDAQITAGYTQVDEKFLAKRTAQYVKAIRDYYGGKNIPIYYKPHPCDGDKLMAGCESSGLEAFRERINAEMMFSKYQGRIVAAYTVSSHSVLFGSMNGIPAYWAYE